MKFFIKILYFIFEKRQKIFGKIKNYIFYFKIQNLFTIVLNIFFHFILSIFVKIFHKKLMFQNRKNISSAFKNLIFFYFKTRFYKNFFQFFQGKTVIISEIFADFYIKITISFVKFLIFFLWQEIPIC